jgi:hypothetical protein
MQRFKSLPARNLVALLQERSARVLLRHLRAHKLRHKTRSTHQVWHEGSHSKQVQNNDLMRQKLTHIHENPMKRGDVEEPAHWRYSSARNYAGQPGQIEVISDWG